MFWQLLALRVSKALPCWFAWKSQETTARHLSFWQTTFQWFSQRFLAHCSSALSWPGFQRPQQWFWSCLFLSINRGAYNRT